MEESWNVATRSNTRRGRIAETLVQLGLHLSQCVKALVSYGSDVEAFLRKCVLGHGEKGKSNHERRKYESKSSDNHGKLRQFITQPRTGRLGYLLFLFAVVGMLAFISQNTSLSQHVDKELERATQANEQRYSLHQMIQFPVKLGAALVVSLDASFLGSISFQMFT